MVMVLQHLKPKFYCYLVQPCNAMLSASNRAKLFIVGMTFIALSIIAFIVVWFVPKHRREVN